MKALFLDIDGVIQASYDQERFEHVKEFVELSKRLTKELDNGYDYYKYGGDPDKDGRLPAAQYDVAAVYYDWRPEIVERLRRILDTTGAKIVLSSDWREKGLHNMRGLLDIHGLGKYLYDKAPFCVPYWKDFMKDIYPEKVAYRMYSETTDVRWQLRDNLEKLYPNKSDGFHGFDERTAEIREFLDRHREITAFAAVDDRDLLRGLEGHFVQTWPLISEEQAQQVIQMLGIEDGPYPLPPEVLTPELEQWRKKMVYNCTYM